MTTSWTTTAPARPACAVDRIETYPRGSGSRGRTSGALTP
jgi:hypothetical protein